MKIVSIGQIVELNQLLKENDIPYKIHIKDACGGQSFHIELLEESISKEKTKAFYSRMNQFFLDHKMTVLYTEDKLNFTIK